MISITPLALRLGVSADENQAPACLGGRLALRRLRGRGDHARKEQENNGGEGGFKALEKVHVTYNNERLGQFKDRIESRAEASLFGADFISAACSSGETRRRR